MHGTCIGFPLQGGRVPVPCSSHTPDLMAHYFCRQSLPLGKTPNVFVVHVIYVVIYVECRYPICLVLHSLGAMFTMLLVLILVCSIMWYLWLLLFAASCCFLLQHCNLKAALPLAFFLHLMILKLYGRIASHITNCPLPCFGYLYPTLRASWPTH